LAKPRARSASAAGIAATGEPWETVRAVDISDPGSNYREEVLSVARPLSC
jgi:hypothetical protein